MIAALQVSGLPTATLTGALLLICTSGSGTGDIQLARQQLALDESLSRVPGVFMQNRYNFAQDLRVSIRGFGARAQFGIRGIKILVDGIPETLPDGQGSVDSIDLGATSTIEVLRGPSSSLWGNASGGVISVTTENPGAEPYSEIRASAGDYGFQKLQFKTSRQGERVGYLFSLSDSDLDGYRDQSRAENTQLTGRFNIDLGEDRKLLTVLNYTDQPVSDDPGGITAVQAAADPTSARDLNVLYDAGENLEQTRVGFAYDMPIGEHSEPPRGVRVRLGCQPQVCDRIADDRVGTALQEDQLRFRGIEVLLHLVPSSEKRRVVGAGRQRNVQLRTRSRTAAGLAAAAGAGIQKASVLVQIGIEHIGIFLEGIEDAVAVMRVDVHIGYAAYAV